jgi:hypothetical protein
MHVSKHLWREFVGIADTAVPQYKPYIIRVFDVRVQISVFLDTFGFSDTLNLKSCALTPHCRSRKVDCRTHSQNSTTLKSKTSPSSVNEDICLMYVILPNVTKSQEYLSAAIIDEGVVDGSGP